MDLAFSSVLYGIAVGTKFTGSNAHEALEVTVQMALIVSVRPIALLTYVV